jgi:hypothetical protein
MIRYNNIFENAKSTERFFKTRTQKLPEYWIKFILKKGKYLKN